MNISYLRHMINHTIVLVGLCVSVMAWAADDLHNTHSSQTWNFDASPSRTVPQDFKVGRLYDGRPAGDWQILEVPEALSSPHVLAQLSDKGAEHAYKLVLIEGTESSDMELSVAVRATGGKGDMGAG